MATYLWPKHVFAFKCMIKDVYGLSPYFFSLYTSTSLGKKMFGRKPDCD